MENNVIGTVKKIDKKIEKKVIPTDEKKETPLDTSLKFAPFALLLASNRFRLRTKNRFERQLIQIAVSEIILNAALQPMKHLAKRKRPNGESNSFPSGHTATCFLGSELLVQELKQTKPALAYSGYCISAITAVLRLYHKKHWFSDVVTGAAMGLASVRLGNKAIEQLAKSRSAKVRQIDARAA